MRVLAQSFHAIFSAPSNRWTIKCKSELSLHDSCEFDVAYLKIEGHGTGDKRLAVSIQEVKATNVIAMLEGNILTIKKWDKIEKVHLWDLFNPDQPRNLAKSVTVR